MSETNVEIVRRALGTWGTTPAEVQAKVTAGVGGVAGEGHDDLAVVTHDL